MFDKHTPWKKVYAKYHHSSKSLPMNEARMKAWSDRFSICMDLPQVPSCQRSIANFICNIICQLLTSYDQIQPAFRHSWGAFGRFCRRRNSMSGNSNRLREIRNELFFDYGTLNCQKCLKVIGGNMWWYVAIDFSNFRTLDENWFGDSSPHPLQNTTKMSFRGCWKSLQGSKGEVRAREVRQTARRDGEGFCWRDRFPDSRFPKLNMGVVIQEIVTFEKSPTWNTSQNVGQWPKKPSTDIDNIYSISIPKLCPTVTSPEFIFGVSQMQTTGPAKVHQWWAFERLQRTS